MRRGSIAEFEVYFTSLNGHFLDFCLSQPNVLNAGNKRNAYIYVIDHDLNFAHVFFNNHVTVPQKKTTKELVANIFLWRNSAVFFIRLE